MHMRHVKMRPNISFATSMPTCGVFETETHSHVQKSTRPYLPIPKLCIAEPRASKMRKASSLVLVFYAKSIEFGVGFVTMYAKSIEFGHRQLSSFYNDAKASWLYLCWIQINWSYVILVMIRNSALMLHGI